MGFLIYVKPNYSMKRLLLVFFLYSFTLSAQSNFENGFNENVKWFSENWEIINDLADFPPGLSSAVR